MKNLIQKLGLAPLVLAAAGIVGCATYQPIQATEPAKSTPVVVPQTEKKSKGIDMRNGFFAESYSVTDNIDLLTQAFFGEAILVKTEKGYKGKKTMLYRTTPSEKFDAKYDEFCRKIDNGDKFLGEMETERFLDNFYDDMFKIIWVEDE